MLLDTLNHSSITGNISTQTNTNFTAELNSIAFDILSKGIYKNPIRALIRELCANAHDAHVCANNQETPFFIQTPDYIEPVFRIRDYGTGIDPALIGQIYFSYFSSNKRHTNTLIGGKGLGSKTPLAYTDSYAVVNYYNGKAYCYIIFKDQTGCPTYKLTDCNDTNEPNGLEVIIAIRKGDFYSFTCEINQTTRWFHCESNTTIPKLKWLVKTKSGGILHDDTNFSAIHIVMGNIPYSYEPYKIIYKERAFLHSSPFHLFANIGDYPVTASRDSVVESDDNTLRISSLTDQFIAELKALIRQRLEGLDRIKAQVQLFQILHEYGIRNAAGDQITYKDNHGQETLLTISNAVDIPIPNQLMGKIWVYLNTRTRRGNHKLNRKIVPKTLCYTTTQPFKLAHSSYAYRKNPLFLNDTPLNVPTYVLHSKDPQDIDIFYGLLSTDTTRTDISYLFAPVPRQRSNTLRTPRTQQPINYSILTPKGIEQVDTLDASQPIWLINRVNRTFVIQNTLIEIPPNVLHQHLQQWIQGTYVVIQKSTPNRLTPKAPYIDITLKTLITEKTELYNNYIYEETLYPHRELYETLIKKLNNKQAFIDLGFENLNSIPEFHNPTWMYSLRELNKISPVIVLPTPEFHYDIRSLCYTLGDNFPIFDLLLNRNQDLTKLSLTDIDIINQYL